MDKTERQRLKEEKLKVVHQKIFRDEIIKSLDGKMADELAGLDYIINPKLQTIINSIRKNSLIISGEAYKSDYVSKKLEDGHFYKEFSWVKEIVQLIDTHLNFLDEDALYFKYLESNSPIFKVTKMWFKKNYKNLLITRYKEIDDIREFFLINKEYDIGIVVSSYGGYLLKDPNPREIVYMLESWS